MRTEDIIATIQNEGEQLAMVLLSGVQYFTGQLFNIKEITKAAHSVVIIQNFLVKFNYFFIENCSFGIPQKGSYIGWDLAHAIGNVELKLHEWDVDFAAWCTYKYLNSGAGSIGGIFLHKKHFNSNLKKLDGWWSHASSTRFQMSNSMKLFQKQYCIQSFLNIFL